MLHEQIKSANKIHLCMLLISLCVNAKRHTWKDFSDNHSARKWIMKWRRRPWCGLPKSQFLISSEHLTDGEHHTEQILNLNLNLLQLEPKDLWTRQPSALVQIPLVPTSRRSYPSRRLHGSMTPGCSRCCPGPLSRWPARGPSWPCSHSGRAPRWISCAFLC